MVPSNVIDEFGIDPLLDPLFHDVDSSVNKEQVIDASLEGNPQRLAYQHYGTSNKYDRILIANAMVHPSELVAGKIKIPSDTKLKRTRKVRTVVL